MQEQYSTTQIGILSEALKNLQTSVNALSSSNNLYFMKAMLESTFTGFRQSTGTDQKIPNFIEQYPGLNQNYGDFNESDQEWICRESGFYKINIIVSVQSAATDELRKAHIQIRLTEDGSSKFIGQGGCDNRTQNSEGNVWTVTCNVLNYIKDNSKIDFLFSWLVDEGDGVSIINTITHFSIQKIS